MRRTVALALVAGLCSAGLSGAAQATPARSADTSPADTITLVTGDRVVLGATPRVIPGPGRESMAFHTSRHDGELTVVPSDATALLAADRLDARLFNVTALHRDGFGDTREDLPLIVTGGFSASVVRELPVLGARSVRARKSELAELWRTRAFDRIWLNGKARPVDDESNAQIGVPSAWKAGFTGKGVTVADLDTGYDASHPDLPNVVASKDFTGTGVNDGSGHGTHTASTIAGSGAASGGRYAGVAPDAKLLVGKVCDNDDACPEDAIIDGMQWAADQGAVIANMSLGGSASDGKDPLSLALNRISAASGTLFVVAAGNAGPNGKVGNPASADRALAVASVTKSDELSRFSSQGPRIGDDAVKPDIAAPGSDIIAARAAGTSMGTPIDAKYTRANGTSMATPHVSGAAALLLQQHPTWRAPELKAALMSSASPLRDLTVYQQGAGRLDVARAVASPVRASAGSVNFGRFPWPRDPKPVKRTVSFHNSGPAAEALTLTAPDAVSLSAKTLTVPAGGAASVDLTFAPRTDGLFSGWLTATGSSVVRVALGASVEPESYDVTVRRELRGDDDVSWFGALVNVATGKYHRLRFLDGDQEVLRLPKGRYDLVGFSESSTSGMRFSTLIAKPNIAVSANTTVMADENTAKPVTAQAGKAKLHSYQATLVAGKEFFTYAASAGTALYATPSAVQSGRVFGFVYRPVLLDGSSVYNLVFSSKDRVPSSLAFQARDLAKVQASYFAQGTAGDGVRADTAVLPWDDSALGFGEVPVKLPGKRTEHFTSGADIRWQQTLSVSDAYVHHERSFPKAGSFTDEWNRAPIGPLPRPVVVEEGEMYVKSALFAPGDAMSASDAEGATGLSELSRDGQVIGRSDEPGGGAFPATSGRLTLTTTARRSALLGTRVDASWTFDGTKLMSVRASGKVSPNGVAASGPFDLTLRVGGHAGAVSDVELSVSYDDGRTWTPVQLTRSGETAKGRLVHPAGGGFVSLRSSARDSAGNSVQQTVFRAYQHA